MAPIPELRRQAWLTTWLLLAVMLINYADKLVLGLAAEPIMAELDLTRTEFGTASSAFFSLFSLASLLGSMLTSKVKTTVLLLTMSLLWSVAQLPMALDVGFTVLIVTRVLLGAAEGPFFPIALHHLYGWFVPRERHLPTAWVTVGGAAGVLVSAPILTFIIHHYGWRAAFGFLGAVGLVWAVVWSIYGKQGPEPADEETSTARSGAGARVPYRRILLSGTWLSGAAAAFAAYWYLASFLTWTTDYWQSSGGLTHTQASSVVMGAAAAAAAILLGYGVLAQRMQRTGRGKALNLVTGASVCLSGAATAVFALQDHRALDIVLMLTLMPLHTVVLVSATTAVAQMAPAPQRGVVLGSLSFVYTLAGGLSPLLVGRIVDGASTTAAGYRTAYLVAGVLLLVTGAVALRFLRPDRDAAALGTAPGGTAPTETPAESR